MWALFILLRFYFGLPEPASWAQRKKPPNTKHTSIGSSAGTHCIQARLAGTRYTPRFFWLWGFGLRHQPISTHLLLWSETQLQARHSARQLFCLRFGGPATKPKAHRGCHLHRIPLRRTETPSSRLVLSTVLCVDRS